MTGGIAPVPERNRDLPRWVVAMAGVLLLGLSGALFAWLAAHDEAGRVAGLPARFASAEPIGSIDLLIDEPNKRNLIARQVVLDDVPVESVVGDHTFWIGKPGERRVAVVLLGELTERQVEWETEIRTGQRLRILGIVRHMKDVRHLEPRPGLLTEQQRQALVSTEIFVSATRVVIVQDAPE